MAATLSSRVFLRSVFVRVGGWQQSHIRTLCKGLPDEPKDESKKTEQSEWDKQREIIAKETVESSEGNDATGTKAGSSSSSSSPSSTSSSSSSDSDEAPSQNIKEEVKKGMSDVKKSDEQTLKEQNLEKSDGKDTQQEKSAEAAEEKRAAAKKRLNELLMSLATTDPIPVEPVTRIDLAKPKPRKKAEKKPKKEVTEQTASPPPLEDIQIDPKLVAASKDVAESLGGDVNETESELLSTLRSHASDTSFDDKPVTNLSELFVGMKVERGRSKPFMEQRQRGRYDRVPTDQPQSLFDREFQRRKAQSGGPGRARDAIPVELFGSKKLGIFDAEKQAEAPSAPESVLPGWDAAHRREMQLSVTHPPPNAFVEMIHWTKQGKLWQFPIDNEFGLEEEKKIGFHEHVFLEHHLDGWCPTRGPIRHFMELVCTGLSKNPYLTVERKIRHINWYKNYFEEKLELLKSIGAVEAKQ